MVVAEVVALRRPEESRGWLVVVVVVVVVVVMVMLGQVMV